MSPGIGPSLKIQTMFTISHFPEVGLQSRTSPRAHNSVCEL